MLYDGDNGAVTTYPVPIPEFFATDFSEVILRDGVLYFVSSGAPQHHILGKLALLVLDLGTGEVSYPYLDVSVPWNQRYTPPLQLVNDRFFSLEMPIHLWPMECFLKRMERKWEPDR